jgi:D-sedoheptulose 7-phosphate isomerase
VSEIEAQVRASIAAKERLLAQGGAEVIERMAQVAVKALKAGGRIYVCGNGGSAADSQHIAGELVGRFLKERAALPCVALSTDTSVLTAVANDYDFSEVFARQVEAHARPGDVVLGISTSGNSPNVVKALERARELGAATLALSGRGGGRLAQVADVCLTAPGDSSPRIQEVHITAAHVLCDLIERRMFGDGATAGSRRGG